MRKILVIEDDKVLRETIVEILINEDYEVFEASNGDEGLRLHAAYNFDLVITDILMPLKDGLEVIMTLKKESPSVKLIAISGGGRVTANDYLAVAKKFGSHEALIKPFNNSELVEKVKALLP
jgi:DNA-binding response OmpR family regulator